MKHKSSKMSMRTFEKSSADKKADKSGKHGKEGSAKDRAADKKMLGKINKGRGK